MSTTIEMTTKPVAALSGAGWELHEACAAWPEMSQLDLRALADDIAAYGLHDPITLTPGGFLLDGRNRALACVMAGVDPTTVIYDGDPWLYSLSKNKHRRHMTPDRVAMVAAGLVTTTQGMNRFVDSSNELSIAKAAEAVGVSETSIKSAKAVIKYGTPEEQRAVETGTLKLRKAADNVRERRRAIAPPASPRPKSNSVKAEPSIDQIEATACEIISTCADGKWRSLSKVASGVKVAEAAAREALKSLGEGCVTGRKTNGVIEYLIGGDAGAFSSRSIAEQDAEIAGLKNQIASLKKRIAEQDTEIERLKEQLAASSLATPSLVSVH